jgi:GTP-dependent phosphoenolpyruvate carboxykinase
MRKNAGIVWLGWDGDKQLPYITYSRTRTQARRRGANLGYSACLKGFNKLTGLHVTVDELKKGLKVKVERWQR